MANIYVSWKPASATKAEREARGGYLEAVSISENHTSKEARESASRKLAVLSRSKEHLTLTIGSRLATKASSEWFTTRNQQRLKLRIISNSTKTMSRLRLSGRLCKNY